MLRGDCTMTEMSTKEYRTAFLEYLRRGTPIRLATKEWHPTTQHVWRSLRDDKVRSSHQENDGWIFAWENPPATGHPGEDYNCRCEAVPYIPGETGFAYREFSTSLASSADRWTDQDFVWHFYNGKGQTVTLLEIGHLREIAEQYAYNDGAE